MREFRGGALRLSTFFRRSFSGIKFIREDRVVRMYVREQKKLSGAHA